MSKNRNQSSKADILSIIYTITALSIYLVFYPAGWSLYLDPICTLILIIHPAKALFLLLKNYIDDIIDKTVPENIQLKIIKSLVNSFAHYDDIKGIRSRKVGEQYFIYLTLEFNPQKTISEIEESCKLIKTDFEKQISNCRINFILKQ